MNRPGFRSVILYLSAAALLTGSGWYAHDWYHRHYSNHNKHRRVKAAGFRFTSPLLDVELPEGFRINSEPIPFKYKVKELPVLMLFTKDDKSGMKYVGARDVRSMKAFIQTMIEEI